MSTAEAHAAPRLLMHRPRASVVLAEATLRERATELADGLLEVGCTAGDILALEHDCVGEALLLALAGLEIGMSVRLGPATLPFRAAFAASPLRAAELSALAQLDPLAVPSDPPSDGGISLERLAAHGIVHRARGGKAAEELPTRGAGSLPAVIGPAGDAISFDDLRAGVRALRSVGDLLRPNEALRIAPDLGRPWRLTLALAGVEAGSLVSIGPLRAGTPVLPDIVAASREQALLLAQSIAAPRWPAFARRARLQSLRVMRGSRGRPDLIARLVGALSQRGAPCGPRCLIVGDGIVPRSVCLDLHVAGTTVLQAAVDDRVAAPVLLNRPRNYRFGALGLPLPGFDCQLVDGLLEVHHADGRGRQSRQRTLVAARPGPGGFFLPTAG